MNADVQAGHPYSLSTGVHPGDVAELDECDQRGELADPVLAHQRAAAVLVAGERPQVTLDPSELDLEHVDDLQRDPDSLCRVGRQLERGQELAAGQGAQVIRGASDPVVIEGRADPLDPAGPLGQQGVTQPRAGAPLANVLGRAPLLRQTSLTQQLSQPFGVRPIGLGATLAATQRAGLHRLSQMHGAAAASTARQTNSQPVHASTATCTTRPGNRPTHSWTAAVVESS